MAKNCLNCKREIAQGQKECYVCGSSQNIISHYFGSSILILLLVLVSAAISFWFITKANSQVESNLVKLNLAQSQIADAEQKATAALNQLKQFQASAEQAEIQQAQNTESSQQVEGLLAAAEKKAVESQRNVNWLAKQNKQLKAEVEQLTAQVTNAHQTLQQSQQSSQLNQQQLNDQVALATQADKTRIQSLETELEALKQQMQTNSAASN
ncbi:MAG: hypothetical protein KUG78_20700 [Kangiellaceae bacterium]|nr:hypothetical protein [Kangiellaceae bacterium]